MSMGLWGPLVGLVVLLLLSNAEQNAMVGPDTSLTGGIITAAVLLGLNNLVARLRLRWSHLRRVVEGSPTLLALHGEPILDHLRREGLDQESLEAAVREYGIADLSEVEMAVLELDGTISVVPVGEPSRRVLMTCATSDCVRADFVPSRSGCQEAPHHRLSVCGVIRGGVLIRGVSA